jgi:lipid II:glycine glycyltransferase (peptidoglycan interpeptide bridge formation enzyme)
MRNLAYRMVAAVERPVLDAAPSAAAPAVRWDDFVAATAAGDLVQTTAWGRAKEATGFAVVTVQSRRCSLLEGGGLLVMKRFGPLGAVGYVARGPLVAGDDPFRVARVLDEVERTARELGVRHLVVQPPEGGQHIEATLALRGYMPDAPDVAPSATIVVDLTPPLATILARMATTRRRSVRQSQRRGVTVRLGGPEDLDAFHALHVATARRQGFAPLSRAYMQAQWEALRPVGAVELFIAELDDQPLAAIWNTVFGDTMTYRIPAWSGEERTLQPNVACHWRAIEWARERGYRRYDLGGVGRHARAIRQGRMALEDLKHCTTAFKVGFGGRVVVLPRAWQLTFNPVARHLVRAARVLADMRPARALVHRLRNG